MSQDYTFVADAMKQGVPWVGTTGIDFIEVEGDRVLVELPDGEGNRNHVGGPHAAVLFGAGETASGAVVLAAFSQHMDKATPLVARAEISYKKVAIGVLRAEAVLGRPAAEVVAELASGTRPEFPVHVTVTNADGVTTAEMTVTWTLRPNR
jgi:acyl-coenzyme A thioesterase PaaI-like protein